MPEPGPRPSPDLQVLCGLATACVLAQDLPLAWSGGPLSAAGPDLGRFGLWFGFDLLLAAGGFLGVQALADDCSVALELRRAGAARLATAAILGLVATLAGAAASGGLRALVGPALAAAAGVENLGLAISSGSGPAALFPYWALSLAAQFWLALGWLLSLPRGPRRLALVAGAALLAAPWGPQSPWRFVDPAPLLMGAFAAFWMRSPLHRLFEPAALARSRAAQILVPGLWLLLMAAASSRQALILPGALGVIAALAGGFVCLAAYGRGLILPERLGARRLFAWLGARTIPLGLLHAPALLAARKIWLRLAPAAAAGTPHRLRFVLTGLALTLAAAELSHRLAAALQRRLESRPARRPAPSARVKATIA